MTNSGERELVVLRHAKSAWNTPAPTDFERPLSKRGLRDAPRMGAWLCARGWLPDAVVASPALRARQTTELVLESMELDPALTSWDRRIYAAGVPDLMAVLAEIPSATPRTLLIGHNPGLEDLVHHLCEALLSPGKFFPTCALALVSLPSDWSGLEPESGTLLELVRPRELED